ncbi:MAG: hypothetical protein HRT67_09690 [Flavobacteriaceae bacterium]|nr:hypothetical protein [Flavobacteriaceae bacterium]
MKIQELFDLLKAHQEKSLRFEYTPKAFVAANYHITEVKHIKIDAIDCGGNATAWNETIIQLWESPKESDTTGYMSGYKALSILNKVGRMKAYDLASEVKFEYSNISFHTAQLFVDGFDVIGKTLVLKLSVENTKCKAYDTCGMPEEKEKRNESSCCTPETGCC